MNRQSQYGIQGAVAAREAIVIGTMLHDLARRLALLEADIATEEERSGVSRPTDPRYTMLARSLAARRDNLKATLTSLQERLAQLQLQQQRPAVAA